MPNSGPAADVANDGGLRLDPVAIRNDYLRDPASLALLRHNNPSMAAALEKGEQEFVSYVNEQQRLKREERERMRRLLANPFDEDAQRLIAEEIRKQNVEKNMEAAMEYHPESFGQVSMLYINCKVNGHAVKAFIDSGKILYEPFRRFQTISIEPVQLQAPK